MNNSQRDAVIVVRSIGRQRRWHLLAGASLAVAGAGAIYHGLRSSAASAEPRAALPSPAQAMIQQSVQPHAANADADVGPGQVEPVLVGAQ